MTLTWPYQVGKKKSCTQYITKLGQHDQFSDQAIWQAIQGSNPNRSKRFFSPLKHPDQHWDPHSLILNGYMVLLPQGQKRLCVRMTTLLHQEFRLGMSGAVSPLSLYALMACCGTSLLLYQKAQNTLNSTNWNMLIITLQFSPLSCVYFCQVTFSPLFCSLSSLDLRTSFSCDLRLLFSHTIWMLCHVHTFILPHNCLTQHGTNRCWIMPVPHHNLQWCILTTAVYTGLFHCDVWQSTGVEEITLRLKHLQWSSQQACALYELAKYSFLTYLFKVPKSLCKQVFRWTAEVLSFTTETMQGSEQSLVCTM